MKPAKAAAAEPDVTFRPKTNRLRPEFESAALYLEQNAFERLSTVSTDNQQKVADKNKSPQKKEEPPKKVDPEKITNKFKNFLERSEAQDKHFKEKRNQLIRELTKTQPLKVNKKSVKMMKNAHYVSSNFLERLEQSAHAKMLASELAAQKFEKEDDLTFKPTINRVSQKLPPRPASEMSSADLQRIMEKKAAIKAQLDKMEQETITLKPKVNVDKNKDVEGYLKLHNGDDSLLARHKDLQKKREELSKRYQELKAEEELAVCTFKPVVKDAPTWVKQQANYMKMKKDIESKNTPQKIEKPQWM